MPLSPRPKKLGPYDVLVKIAGGGMATIYLARTPPASGEERLVAVKVIRHDLRHDQQYVEMFLDEARVLARLSHPNIATIFESGTDDEQHFIAMELLVGRNLAEVWDACRERKLTLRLDHAAWIAARVADALHYAHELTDDTGAPLGVIHRDVNPSNVFLTFDGDVKLFDFGLAKARGRQTKSTHGVVKGKLPYLAPEQFESLALDRRSDIYMLGTTLWEMTTMRRLFKRTDDLETVAVVRAALVPDPRARNPEYPDELWRIVRRTLARDRNDRYPTALELARDLDAFVVSHGRGDDLGLVTSAILDALFPGEREKQAMWLRRAKEPRAAGAAAGRRETMAPPVPIPGVDASVPSVPPRKRPSSRPPPKKASTGGA
ncbi:MAG TPA: serine/threonine-protein kinase [Polyangiaceae bacterium]|nr:serine/threonine-protein kinase [Polyangiaceae bacterium]